jgi:hypothetical protein
MKYWRLSTYKEKRLFWPSVLDVSVHGWLADSAVLGLRQGSLSWREREVEQNLSPHSQEANDSEEEDAKWPRHAGRKIGSLL